MQIAKRTYCMIAFIWNYLNDKTTDTENRLVVPGVKGG